MPNALVAEIRKQLARYLDGEISLDTFEDWFVSHTWNMHLQKPNVVTESLRWDIEDLLAQYTSGSRWTEEDLKTQLRSLMEVRPTSIIESHPVKYYLTASSSFCVTTTEIKVIVRPEPSTVHMTLSEAPL